MKAPTGKQYSAYQWMFDFFNKELFDGLLATCILVFSSRNSKVAGHFAKDRWQRSDQLVHEININPAYIASADDICITSTLVHEMVHLWQAQIGSAGAGGYHNKEWSAKMKKIGLMPSDTGKLGGNKTGFKMKQYVIKGGKFELAFNRMPKGMLLPFKTKIKPNNEKKKVSKDKIKYSCPKCSTNLWGKPNLTPICGNCLVQMSNPNQDVNLDGEMTIHIEAMRIAAYFLGSIKDQHESKEMIAFQFVDELFDDIFGTSNSALLEDETKLRLLYRFGNVLDSIREKGPLSNLVHGRYTLN